MSEIVLNAVDWKNKDDFYTAYCNVTSAPNWFGKNLDALLDSFRGGICKITPEKIVIRNLSRKKKELFGSTFWKEIEEMCQEEDVQLEIHPD